MAVSMPTGFLPESPGLVRVLEKRMGSILAF